MDFIKIEKQNSIAIVYFNRPEKLNSFNAELLLELKETFSQLENDKNVRLIMLTGAGDKSFSTGVDLVFLSKLTDIEENRAFASLMESTSLTIFNTSKPTIAIVNGYAFGGGFGMAAACDFRIISDKALVGFPAVKLGAIMPVTCTSFVINLIGFPKTKKLMLTGETISARQAYEIGLAEELVEHTKLMDRAFEIAEKILEGGDLALQLTKKTINSLAVKDLKAYSLYAIDNFAYLSQTKDWKQRMNDFIEKLNKK